MIVVDTSALISILLREADAAACSEAVERERHILNSAGTLAEALIVSARRGIRHRMTALIDRIEAEVVPVTAEAAKEAADAYDRWGKGVHPAALNYADCFAYALAKSRAAPLLYVGNDFRRTDVVDALG